MRFFKQPALGMALLGAMLFLAMQYGGTTEQRRQIIIAPQQLQVTLQGFTQELGRPPTEDERQWIIDELVDEAILFQYALDLGMHKGQAAQRRLALIADFVRSDPHPGPSSEAELAAQAVELGLHRGDLVARRIMIDSARRLIRGVVLMHQPQPEYMEEYLESHPQRFERPGGQRISQITINAYLRGENAEARAGSILEQIRLNGLGVDEALKLSDQSVIPNRLPMLTQQALATRFDKDFAEALSAQSVGRWVGPLPSRHGEHLVYIHERTEPYVPPLAELGPKLRQEVMDKLADDWLSVRLQQLREAYDIVLPKALDSGAQVEQDG